jgi:wobble nucleotide-excising tRNase
MIDKIISIQNVGKFLKCSYSGDTSFCRITLVYAENGLGKTTFCAILRSLRDGEARLVEERTTLGQSTAPSVHLLCNGASCKFTAGRWDSAVSGIEIFDPTFINDNVHSGECVEHEHKKNLHRFAIGEEGVQLAKRIVELDGDIRQLNSEISSKKLQLQRHIVGAMEVDVFVDLKAIENIDIKIVECEREVATQRKADAILKKPLLSRIPFPEPEFDEIEKLLSKGIDNVADKAEHTVKQHILRCMDARGESWVGQGLQYIKEDFCPFCGQGLQGIDPSLSRVFQ